MALSRSRLLRLCRARDRLVEDWNEGAPTSIAALAEEAGLSTGVFIREFARLFGETPHQRRIRARVERAKHRLARGESVTRVCFDVGWSSLGSFSASFHRRVGVSPSAYRAEARRWVQVPGGLRRALSPGCFELMAAAYRAQFSRSDARRGLAPSRP